MKLDTFLDFIKLYSFNTFITHLLLLLYMYIDTKLY